MEEKLLILITGQLWLDHSTVQAWPLKGDTKAHELPRKKKKVYHLLNNQEVL